MWSTSAMTTAGGNDESVYLSDFPYLTIDDYRTFPQVVAPLL